MRTSHALGTLCTWSTLALLLLAPLVARAQEDLTAAGHVTSDLHQNPDHPPAALLDGDVATHFAQHRLEGADWRVWLGKPGVVEQITLVQGYSDWSQAIEVRLDNAYGEATTITLQVGTREEQAFAVPFSHPTAFVDVTVLSAQAASDGAGWGGFAKLRCEGAPVDPGAAAPPVVSNVVVQSQSDTAATITWSTDRPASSQVRFSTELVSSELTTATVDLATQHSVEIQAAAPLRGYLEIRSADAAGFRAEHRHPAFVTIDTDYSYGVGGWNYSIGGEWIRAPELFAQDDLQVGFVQQWIGGSGWTEWFQPEYVQELVDAGYTPEVIHYFFGDPSLDDVIARQAEFIADIQTLAQILAASGVGDQVLVTLEPEYNQGDVATWEGWNDLMIEAMEILRSQAGCKVGLLPGDWDIDHVLPISMGRAAAFADFVAFQEMRASTRNVPADAYEVVDRGIRFSHYLSRKFLRPVRLGYVMVSDYGGWTGVQRDVVIELCERYQELEAAGTVATSWMSYLDRPGAGGYFDEAEAHKGLKYFDNVPKPAWHVFQECAKNGPSWLATGQPPPGEIPPPPPREEDEGCGCRVTGRPVGGLGWSGWWLALGLALAVARGWARRGAATSAGRGTTTSAWRRATTAGGDQTT